MSTTIEAPLVAAPVEPVEAVPTDVFSRVIPFMYERHYWGEHRKESMTDVDVAADRLTPEDQIKAKALMTLNKRMIESPEINNIRLVDRRFGDFMRRVATPWRPSEFFVPVGLVQPVHVNAKKWIESRERLADEATATFPQRIAEMAEKDPLHDPDFYPTPEEFRAKFTASYRFMDFGVPELLRALSEHAFEEERAKMAELGREAEHMIEQHLAGSLLAILTHLKDLLAPRANGRMPSLRDEALKPLLEFMALVPMRDATNFTGLQNVVKQLEQLQSGVTVDALRDDKQFRAVIATRMEELAASVSDLVVDDAQRAIRLRK